MDKNRLIMLAVMLAVLIAGILYVRSPQDKLVPPTAAPVTTFEECAAGGNPVQESYPPRCTTKDGKTFTQDIGNEMELQDIIRSTNPRPYQKVTSPLSLTGTARGTWFFEAQFSGKIVDDTGQELGVGIITAQGEWMTEEFVPYSGEIVFTTPSTAKGKLILEKNNPSGLPEHDASLNIPITF